MSKTPMIISKTDFEKYRSQSIEHTDFERLFFPCGCVPAHDISAVQIFTEQDSKSFWSTYFSQSKKSVMQLDKEDWPCSVEWTTIGSWLVYFNNESPEPVTSLLETNVNYQSETPVLFCSGYKSILKTDWNFFKKHWMKFLEFEDDGPIVLAPEKKDVLTFTPLGEIQIAHLEK